VLAYLYFGLSSCIHLIVNFLLLFLTRLGFSQAPSLPPNITLFHYSGGDLSQSVGRHWGDFTVAWDYRSTAGTTSFCITW